MSKIKDLALDIQDELENGFLSFDQIAAKYEVPVSWVNSVAMEIAQQLEAEYDGQPDEAQEWHDFDPDC